MFVENGYNEASLRNIIQQMRTPDIDVEEEVNNKKYVSLPWVPGLSPKLKKDLQESWVHICV